MSLKRIRGASRGSSKWDVLPWKSIEPTLERDDGWQKTGGDDQAFVYSLEEIPGGEYALHCHSSGGTKIVVARDRDEPSSERAGPHAEGARGKGTVTSIEGSIDDQGKDHGHGKNVKGVGKKGVQKRKASPGDGEGGEKYEPTTRTASAVTADISSVETSSIAPVDMGKEGIGGESGKEGERQVDRVGTRHKRKRRRGQGKKNNTEAKSNTAETDGLARGIEGGNEVEETRPCSAFSRVGDRGNVAGTDAASDGVPKDLEQNQHAGQATSEEVAAGPQTGVVAAKDSNRVKKKAKKKKKKKRKSQDGNEMMTKSAREADNNQGDGAAGDDSVGRRDRWELSADDSAKMLPWLYLGVELHPALLWHLHRQGFYDPTPIQKRVLPKAILGRKDVIGAAETGSGKTLAFGLPILNDILTRRDAAAAAAAAEAADATRVASDSAKGQEKEKSLQALVLCPTRELALQVAAHFREVVRDTGLSVVAVVGGLAEVKQERQLSQCPEVVVATPGRFWELARTHAYLFRLETLRHLVVDEADRMLERGHYPELKRLFATLGSPEEDEEELRAKGDVFGRARAFEESVHSGRHRLRRWEIRPGLDKEGEPGSLWSDDGADEIIGMEDDSEEDNSDDNGLSGNTAKIAGTTAMVSATKSVSSPARNFSRQTYVFSATLLTRGATGRRQKKRNKNAVHRGASDNNDDGNDESDPVTKIMRRLGVRGDPAVIDVGRRGVERHEGEDDTAGCRSDVISVRTGSANDVGTPALPSTLRLCSIKSLQMEKDVHVYLFCATYPGRTLVFVNAIACARRLAVLLCTLGIKATSLHAQMQQRQRLKSLDRFTSDPKAVMVATDVAARGLDIPKVEHVVHYDAARSAEVFVHRAGRTARARAAGLSLSIVAPRDDAHHRQTCSMLGLLDGMQAFPVEMRLVDRARERVGMALKVMKFEHEQSKVSASNDFFRVLSKDADLVMDGDLLVEGGADDDNSDTRRHGRITGMGRKGNRHAERLAAEARRALEVSLSRPLHVDRRKLIPVAQALVEARKVSQRTAAGDLLENQSMTRNRQRRKVSL